MALEGNVSDFGLSEILQLVALQKKTGMLAIEGERTMVIYFCDGQVISTRDRRSMSTDPLREYILRYGILSKEEMTRINRIQEETKIDLTDILLSEKKFSEDELRELFAEQIQESIQEVLTWPRSQYRFVIGNQVLQGVRSFGGFKVEALLMESMRRIDELPELQRLLPSDDTAIMKVEPPDGNFPELEQTEEDIYSLIGNKTTLGELVPRARMARFCTMETLKQLLEKGLIQIVPVEKKTLEAETAPEKSQEIRSPARRRPNLASAAVLIIAFATGELAVPRILPPGWSMSLVPHPATMSKRDITSTSGIEGIKERLLEQRIKLAVEEHYAMFGFYCGDLDALVAKGLASARTVHSAKEMGLMYRAEKNGRSFSLERKNS